MKAIEQLIELVEKETDYKPAQRCFVSIYSHSQHFGGPEEGGWWYDRMQWQGSKPFNTREEAEAWLEKAKEQVEQMNRNEAPARARACASLPDEDEVTCPAGYSEGYIPNDWTDGGEYEVLIEERQGEQDNMNEPRPHYE